MSRRQMHLAAASAMPCSASPFGWLEPGVDPANYTDVHVLVRALRPPNAGSLISSSSETSSRRPSAVRPTRRTGPSSRPMWPQPSPWQPIASVSSPR